MRNKIDENWRVGRACLKDNNINAAASRIYYGVFQAVLYYARKKRCSDVAKNQHRIHALMVEIVSSHGIGSEHFGRQLKEMLVLRKTADYDPETPSWDDVVKLLPDCEKIRDNYLRKAEEKA